MSQHAEDCNDYTRQSYFALMLIYLVHISEDDFVKYGNLQNLIKRKRNRISVAQCDSDCQRVQV